MGVWVVVVVLAVGTVSAIVASRHHAGDVEPTVREFTEFRDALSRQVTGLSADTRVIHQHLDHEHLNLGVDYASRRTRRPELG